MPRREKLSDEILHLDGLVKKALSPEEVRSLGEDPIRLAIEDALKLCRDDLSREEQKRFKTEENLKWLFEFHSNVRINTDFAEAVRLLTNWKVAFLDPLFKHINSWHSHWKGDDTPAPPYQA